MDGGSAPRLYRELMEAVVASAPDPTLVVGADGRITLANAAAYALLGYDAGELGGRSVDELVPEGLRGRHAAHRASYVVAPSLRVMGTAPDLQAARRDGRLVPVRVSLGPLETPEGPAVLVAIRPRTAPLASDAELRSLDALAAAGRVAATLAHDINNLTTVVMFALSELRTHIEPGLPGHAELDQIEAAIGVVTDLSRRLQRSATDRPEPAFPVDLGELVVAWRPLLTALVRKRGRLTIEVGEPSPRVVASPTVLQRVVVNLVLNAVEAIRPGGRIAVVVRAEGTDALLEVADDGVGMDEPTLARLWEPFFSTKNEAGRGVGLYAAHTLVEGLGGSIRVTSRPGGGTRFTVALPRA